MNDDRKICVGCLTGNYYLCNSFPGRAPEHAQYEIDRRVAVEKRLEAASRRKKVSVFQREEE